MPLYYILPSNDLMLLFSVIHDSVLARATDMALLSTLVRETYMFLFAENDYLIDFANQIGAREAPPIIGTLNQNPSLIQPIFSVNYAHLPPL